ncbi:MAG: YigZ family protein [Clostridiales bacterium]|nr:YigZ family protein [Clostridiales bacterium]
MSYRSVLNYSETEYIVEKSRFITYVKPVDSEEEAQNFIEEIKKKNWNANHNVPVYIIGENMAVQKFSDDGEPSGTAGYPVLEMLRKENIINLVIVITRYFGGVKLGKGGLIRAYTQSAKIGIEASNTIEYREMNKFQLTYAYNYHGKIENYISSRIEIFDMNSEFLEQVTKEILMPVENKLFFDELIEITGNQIEIKKTATADYSILNGKIVGVKNEKYD